LKFPRQNKTITVRRNALGHDQRLQKAYDQIKFIWSFLSSWHDEDSEKKKGKICGTHLVMINANRNLTIKLKTWSFLSYWHDEDSEKKKGKICGTHLVMINANRNLTIKLKTFSSLLFCRTSKSTRHQLDNFCYLLILL
jgi:hypothetical protein